MVEPFGDQDKDGGSGKRPAQTIEGTATEVSIEPGPGEAPADAPPGPAAASAGTAAAGAAEDQPTGAEPHETADSGDTPPPPRTSPTELRGFLTHLAAGLLGGLIGVLTLAFAWGLLGPASDGQSPAAVEQRLAKLEAEPASSDAKGLAALDQRLKALEARKPAPQQDLSAVMARVAKLQASLDTLAKSAGEGSPVADAAALDAKLGDIAKQLDGRIAAALDAQDAAQGKSLEMIEGEIAALRAKLGALAEAKLDPEAGDFGPELTALDERIGKLEAALPRLAGAIDRGTASAKSGAAAIAFANLREAVASGRPYASELAALNAVAPKLGDLGVLPSRADTGIPTASALAEDLRAKMQTGEAGAPGAGDASFIDSVIASAKSAVRVRRVDAAPTGSEPDAVLARAEAALDEGNLAGAVKEVEALPPAAREPLAPWLETARARLSADATVAELQIKLLSSLSGTAGEATPSNP
jgi:hypothetical protein